MLHTQTLQCVVFPGKITCVIWWISLYWLWWTFDWRHAQVVMEGELSLSLVELVDGKRTVVLASPRRVNAYSRVNTKCSSREMDGVLPENQRDEQRPWSGHFRPWAYIFVRVPLWLVCESWIKRHKRLQPFTCRTSSWRRIFQVINHHDDNDKRPPDRQKIPRVIISFQGCLVRVPI